MKINQYQAERIRHHIDTRKDDPKLCVIMVVQYTPTLFAFTYGGGGKVIYEITKMGQWKESRGDIIYHITHRENIEFEKEG